MSINSVRPTIIAGHTRVVHEGQARFKSAIKNPTKTLAPDVAASMEKIRSLAQEYTDGKISKDEINQKFVEAVLGEPFQGKLSKQDHEDMILRITSLFKDDPDLSVELERNLREVGNA